ncbi:hypothetical protein ACFOLL_04325 [Falsochrobactrum ovis]|uniref:Uncharacterized protein n=1 Tax=Falsochrobactrum ovis TaxID=1293442 RepID=A0A364JUN4_9HYPH|nr:hypothetical protein [Falsochrobactrum ovis]RAK28471.1 hypothetical protein C7374_1062 [Falsochrobactrum ovis]
MMALIPNWLKLTLAALLAAFFVFGAGYAYGTMKERQRVALAAAEATARAIQKRAEIDEKIIGMDSYRLCLELGGLPDGCKQLRRLEAN